MIVAVPLSVMAELPEMVISGVAGGGRGDRRFVVSCWFSVFRYCVVSPGGWGFGGFLPFQGGACNPAWEVITISDNLTAILRQGSR